MARPIVHLIPHTHWDREWYLPLGGFRARWIGALDGLLAQLESDSRLVSFLLDGQTVLIEDYLSVRPERRASVSALVRAGRLQVGPWYVLADEQIPAGESLLRNLGLGQRDATQLGGRLDVLHSPDAFGHPPVWPALGAEFGIESGVLWRGVTRAATGDRDLAWWDAPDGRRILCYHLPPDGYEIGAGLLCPDAELAAAWRRVASQVLPRAATRQVAVFVGADHHAADPGLGALPGRLAAVVPEVEFRCSPLGEFLRAARDAAGELAVLTGEQRWSAGYTWSLQGVHATRAPLKRRNSGIELGLVRHAEPLVALIGGGDHGSLTAVLEQAWRQVVQSHFHDAIGGCAADSVARAMTVRFDDAEAALLEVTRLALHKLTGHDPDRAREGGASSPRLALWNPVARPRGGVAVADLTFFRRDILVGPPGGRAPRHGVGVQPFVLRCARADGSISDVAPQVLESQVGLERLDAARHYPDQDEVDRIRVAFPLPEALPGLGLRLLETVAGDAAPQEAFASARGRRVWNGRVEATVERLGTVALGPAGAARPFTGLLALVSERDAGDTYSFCPVSRDRRRQPSRAVRPVVTAAGPFVAGLGWSLTMRCGAGVKASDGRVDAQIGLEAIGDSPVLRCVIALDNQARDHRLRLRLPTGLRGVPVLAGAQFGAVVRRAGVPAGAPTPIEKPFATAPAHRWVAAAKGRRGLAVFAPGFFEYEWTASGELLITLLRSVGELSRSNLTTRPGHAGWPTPTPEAQCLGEETIELGLAPVSAEDLASPDRLERMWEDALLPPLAHWIRDFCPVLPPMPPETGVRLEGEGLAFSACTLAEGGHGAVFRCYNLLDRVVLGAWHLGRKAGEARLVRADGAVLEKLNLADGGRTVRFTAKAHGIVSVLVEWLA